jgi:hypothetical protein
MKKLLFGLAAMVLVVTGTFASVVCPQHGGVESVTAPLSVQQSPIAQELIITSEIEVNVFGVNVPQVTVPFVEMGIYINEGGGPGTLLYSQPVGLSETGDNFEFAFEPLVLPAGSYFIAVKAPVGSQAIFANHTETKTTYSGEESPDGLPPVFVVASGPITYAGFDMWIEGCETGNGGGGQVGCPTPSSVSASAGDEGEIDVTWTAADGETEHKIQWSAVGSGNWDGTTVSGSSYSITGLAENTEYLVRVRTFCDAGGASQYVLANNATTVSNACGIPSSLSGGAATATSIDLSWSAETGATYKVRYRPLTGGAWQTANAATNSTTLSGLNQGTPYQWQVRSFCPAGPTMYSAPEVTGTSTGCADPSELATTDVTENSATLSWSAVTGAVKYKVRMRDGGAWQYYKPATNSVAVSNLNVAGNYTWQVRAMCTGIGSKYSTSTLNLLPPRFGAFDEAEELAVYPNPASEVVSVVIPEYQLGGTLDVLNSNGMLIETMSIDATEMTLNVSEYGTGIYMVKVTSIDGVEVQQIVVE